MSYVRKSRKSSDVYVIGNVGGYLECCGCEIALKDKPSNLFLFYFGRWLHAIVQLLESVIQILTLGLVYVSLGSFKLIMWSTRFGSHGYSFFHCKKYSEMIAHLREHRSKGQLVPQSAFDRLRREMEDGDLFAPEYVEIDLDPEADVYAEEEDDDT